MCTLVKNNQTENEVQIQMQNQLQEWNGDSIWYWVLLLNWKLPIKVTYIQIYLQNTLVAGIVVLAYFRLCLLALLANGNFCWPGKTVSKKQQ